MKLKSFDHMNCSLAQTLDVIGERWTLLILRDAFVGIRRFDQFQRDLGIARNILAARLSRLVDEGILERRPTDDSRHEFSATSSLRSTARLRAWTAVWSRTALTRKDGLNDLIEYLKTL